MADFKTRPELGTSRQIFCNSCRNKTHHELVFVHQCAENVVFLNPDTPHEEVEDWDECEYRLWVCRGCGTAVLEKALYCDLTEQWLPDYYPKREHRDLPQKGFQELNRRLTSIYREVIESFNAGLQILCAVGLRALLEGICADKGVEGKTLEEKINRLDRFLPSSIVKNLHGFRFMGNEAAHELQAPDLEELRVAIDVMEDLLNYLYALDYKAQWLPKRRRERDIEAGRQTAIL
jgi:hypothetical protein